EVTISHQNFIETVWEAANTFFSGEQVDSPDSSETIDLIFSIHL
ncbi:DUF3871 family protein, partial [Bacteroides sp. 519]|nr:DUF3871 family protein [Bacteroides sp. 519]